MDADSPIVRKRRNIRRAFLIVCLLAWLGTLGHEIAIGPPGGWTKDTSLNIQTTLINSIFQTLNLMPYGIVAAIIFACAWYAAGKGKE